MVVYPGVSRWGEASAGRRAGRKKWRSWWLVRSPIRQLVGFPTCRFVGKLADRSGVCWCSGGAGTREGPGQIRRPRGVGGFSPAGGSRRVGRQVRCTGRGARLLAGRGWVAEVRRKRSGCLVYPGVNGGGGCGGVRDDTRGGQGRGPRRYWPGVPVPERWVLGLSRASAAGGWLAGERLEVRCTGGTSRTSTGARREWGFGLPRGKTAGWGGGSLPWWCCRGWWAECSYREGAGVGAGGSPLPASAGLG